MGNRWSYIDGRGVPSTGELQDIIDSGHNDITYSFINDKTGKLDLVSGSRLKQMKKIESYKFTLSKELKIGNYILEKGDIITILKEMDVATKHQIKIAKDTLKMNDVMASVMGGMTKDEARAVLRRNGYSDQAIRSMEESIKEIRTPTPQEVADALQGVSLMSARSILESMFGRKNVDFGFSPYAHYSISTPQGDLVIINKKYVEPDEDTIIVDDLAIGYL